MQVAFRSDCSPLQIEAARRLGFTCLELMWEEPAWKRRDAILAEIPAAGIGICAMLLGEERTPAQLRDDIDYAVAIGCPVLCLHPHPLDPAQPDGIAAFVGRHAEALAYATVRGIAVTMPSCGHGPRSWDAAFTALPGLKLKYDPSFSFQAGRSYRQELVRYGQRIAYVHAKDEMLIERDTDFSEGRLRFRYAPAGMGEISWGSVIALLYECGFDGAIGIEAHSPFWWDSSPSKRWKSVRSSWELGLLLAKRHLESFIVT